MQYLEEGLVRSFVSAFGEKFAFFCTETLQVKNCETDIKCITWRDLLAHARWKSRRLLAVVSLSYQLLAA